MLTSTHLDVAQDGSSVKPQVIENIEELQYLRLVKDILANGEVRSDRTGTGTKSLFAPPQMKFSLANSAFPLLTTKRTFIRPIFEELMWFIRGSTDSMVRLFFSCMGEYRLILTLLTAP